MLLVLRGNELTATTPTAKMTTNRKFRITKSPLRLFRKSVRVASCCSLGGENWIALHVDPIRRSCGDVAAQAVFLVVRCDLLVGRVGLEQRPSPSITPQRVAGIASLFAFDHDEPHLCSRGPMCVTRCHLSVVGSEDLFDQDGTVRKLPILSVILSRTGRGVGEVHLVSLRIQHCICPKHLVMVAIISWLLNIFPLCLPVQSRRNSQRVEIRLPCSQRKRRA